MSRFGKWEIPEIAPVRGAETVVFVPPAVFK